MRHFPAPSVAGMHTLRAPEVADIPHRSKATSVSRVSVTPSEEPEDPSGNRVSNFFNWARLEESQYASVRNFIGELLEPMSWEATF